MNEITKKDESIQITKAQLYAAKFDSFNKSIAEINERTKVINISNPTDADAKLARELRLEAVKVRTGALKLKDAEKESLLNESNLIQSEFNRVKAICETTETELSRIEKHREIELARIKEELRINRSELLSPYVDNVSLFPVSEMTQEAFDTLLNGQKLVHEAKVEALRKAEAERIERERLEAEEREKQRLENIRLKEEAEKREKEIAAERAKAESERKKLEEKAKKEKALADAKLKAEKEANEKLQAEIKAKAEAEAKAKRDEQARIDAELKAKAIAEKKAKAAPDKEKLSLLIGVIAGIEMPEVSSDEAKDILKNVNVLLGKVVNYIEENSNKL